MLLVPLLICAPLPIDSDPVDIITFPAFPQAPEHLPPIVSVKIPLGWMVPRAKSSSGLRPAVSPDMETESVA